MEPQYTSPNQNVVAMLDMGAVSHRSCILCLFYSAEIRIMRMTRGSTASYVDMRPSHSTQLTCLHVGFV